MTTGGTIGVGMLGYAFMGKAHSRAFREAKALHAPLAPELVSLSERRPDKVEAARKELGWAEAVTGWREQVAVERENGVVGTREALPARARARLNELEVADERPFRRVLVTEPEHPFMSFWWPPGHIVGWGDTFTHEIHHLLTAIAGEGTVGPHGATFEDGYRCAEVCDAIVRSAESGTREEITYRGVEG